MGMQTVTFEGSMRLYERASASLAGGVSTAFRAYEKPTPLFVREARGSRVIDVDGNEYVDFVCGFGPIILGHSHPAVVEAVSSAASRLQQVGAQHEAELELAERLCLIVPSFERVRFSLSGSEAVHAALRVARAATGRTVIVKFAGHYHGWFDGIYAGTAHLPPGLPETAGQSTAALADLVVIEWNDEQALRELFSWAGSRIAGVIMEPIACNGGVIYPRTGYLELVRSLTAEAGALLIFDEVITGFRVGLGGAQAELGVVPDLTVIAKAMANGFPISAFGGRADVMELIGRNEVLHAGTYNGGGISVAATLATIGELAANGGAVYGQMRTTGQRLMDGLRAIAAHHGHRLVVQGPGPVFFAWFLNQGEITSYRDHLRADAARYARFAELLLSEGIRVIPSGRWYLSAAHGDREVDLALEAADRALSKLTP